MLVTLFCRPGSVKDFVKKVKQEDARITMRKKTLAKTAERIAQARAKAAAAAVPEAANPNAISKAEGAVAMMVDSSGPISTHETAAPQPPIHPSLPARPSSATATPVKHLDAPAMPPSGPAPTIFTPTPAPPPEPWISDEQIMKYEEVSSPSSEASKRNLTPGRTNNDGLG
jgi:THO complex subunit 1